jgi:hypothetical protein
MDEEREVSLDVVATYREIAERECARADRAEARADHAHRTCEQERVAAAEERARLLALVEELTADVARLHAAPAPAPVGAPAPPLQVLPAPVLPPLPQLVSEAPRMHGDEQAQLEAMMAAELRRYEANASLPPPARDARSRGWLARLLQSA